MYASLGSLFLGLALGIFASRWWPPGTRVVADIEQFSRLSAWAFWIVFGMFGLWMLVDSAVSAPWCLGAWYGYGVGLGSVPRRRHPTQHRQLWNVTLVAVRVAVAGLLVLTPVFGDALLRAFSLDFTDTVAAYREAHVEDVVRLRMRLCWNGECLTKRDWACGFTNGDTEAFDRCFDHVVERAAPLVRLEDARKFCGNLTMKFVGETYSTPEECVAAGGKWGVKLEAPRLGF